MMAETLKGCCLNGSNGEWYGRGWCQIGLTLRHNPPNRFEREPYNPSQYPKMILGDWTNTGSMHTGGTQILMADGGVRFLSQNTAASIRKSLDLIADGTVLGEF